MILAIDATYQNGILRPDSPLPLKENERVKITVESDASIADRCHGLLAWTGEPAVLLQIAEEDGELYTPPL